MNKAPYSGSQSRRHQPNSVELVVPVVGRRYQRTTTSSSSGGQLARVHMYVVATDVAI